MLVAAIAATATNQRICCPAPLLIPDKVRTATVVVFVNNAGVLWSKLPIAAIVHISAGQKEEAVTESCFQEAAR